MRPVHCFPAKGSGNLSRMQRFWEFCGAKREHLSVGQRSTTILRSASHGRICRGGCSARESARISPFRLRHNAAERKKKKQHEKTNFWHFTGAVHGRVARGVRRCGRYEEPEETASAADKRSNRPKRRSNRLKRQFPPTQEAGRSTGICAAAIWSPAAALPRAI